MFRLGKLFRARLTWRLLWDLFMVWVAVINLGLIIFDLTYLWLRPLAVDYLPAIVEVYDPVKGIEPHPLTEELLAALAAAHQGLQGSTQSELVDHQRRLSELTLRLFAERPFERSGQTANLDVIRAVIAAGLGQSTLTLDRRLAESVAAFFAGERELFRQRLGFFETRIRPLLAANFFREYDLQGHLPDHFWLLDLPFLALFWAEFLFRWAVAIRRKSHNRWFFFPIYNWYDLLGLVPNVQFRFFRLFRIASIYMRLRKSRLIGVGEDILSRTVSYISNIITEEITDMVSLRILTEYQEEIRDGTHLEIFHSSISSRRAEIEEIVVTQLRQVMSDPEAQDQLRRLLRLNVDTAVEETSALRSIPLPAAVVKPVIAVVAEVLLNTAIDTINTTLDSEEGRQQANDLVASVLDRLFTGPGIAEIESLSEEIAFDIFEQMKKTVAVKKWAQSAPEDPKLLAEDAAPVD